MTIDDAQDVFEWAGDPLVNKYMPYPLHKDIRETEEWIGTLGEKNEFCFCLKETAKVIGSGSISFDEESGLYELGYNLNRRYWGKGYATEASKAMIGWAHEQLHARDFFYAACQSESGLGKGHQKVRVSVHGVWSIYKI